MREVFGRPKFRKYLGRGRTEHILGVLTAAARFVEPVEHVNDCRDAKDNKYLELALAAGATTIVATDDDLLVMHPWRGIEILTPAEFLASRSGIAGGLPKTP